MVSIWPTYLVLDFLEFSDWTKIIQQKQSWICLNMPLRLILAFITDWFLQWTWKKKKMHLEEMINYVKPFDWVCKLLHRLSQSHSLLISGSGSWPQLEALSLTFAAENKKKSTARAREKIWSRFVGKSSYYCESRPRISIVNGGMNSLIQIWFRSAWNE